MIISKKKREKALRLIIDFESKRKKDTYIDEEYLIYHGFDKLEALQTLEVLNGMGYIKYNNKPRITEKYISLTDKGICYFETKKDARVEFIKKNIIVPIIVSIITTLATLIITNHIADNKPSNNIDSTKVENK